MPDPEKSKIKITAPKIPILIMTDFGDTGFGTVGKELSARLAEMEVFDVHYLGWFATQDHKEEGKVNGYTLHCTGDGDHFGNRSLDGVIAKVRPKVVLTLGDPWMVAHVHNSAHRDTFSWVNYMPVDRDYVSRTWRTIMKKCDVLVLYSQFGVDVVNEQLPFRHPELILHGVDRMTFHEWYPPGMDKDTELDVLMKERKRITMGVEFSEKWVVGFVGRNQIRKAIPRAFKSFKAMNCATWCERQNVDVTADDGSIEETYTAEEFCKGKQKFRCDVCPAFQQRPETLNTVLYLHTTRGDGSDAHDKPGIGWLIDEIAERYEIQGRVGMTPGITALKGITRAALSQLMNCFDTHLFLSHSEGFGLPIAEGLACGAPTLVTDYSAMPELVSGGGGMTVEVADYDTFTTWENEWASADIGDAADKLNQLFMDKELYARMRKEAAASTYVPTWDDVALQFRELIIKASKL